MHIMSVRVYCNIWRKINLRSLMPFLCFFPRNSLDFRFDHGYDDVETILHLNGHYAASHFCFALLMKYEEEEEDVNLWTFN